MARRASRETLGRDQISRTENDKAAALRCLVKLQLIANGISDLHRTIENMITEADAQGHAAIDLWQKIMPFAGVPNTDIRFEADELKIFVATEALFFNDLCLLAQRYTTLKDALRDYMARRLKLTDELSVLGPTMRGLVGSVLLNSAEAARFAPRAVELNMLAGEMRDGLRKDNAFAMRMIGEFGPKVRKILNDSTFPLLTIKAPGTAEKTGDTVSTSDEARRVDASD
jgi:hypothetical protein